MRAPIRLRAGRLREETGAVLVMVAIALPVMIGAAGLVLDVGNWFAHRRHLQVQADAGALAAAGKYLIPCTSAVSDTIKATAGQYSGPSAEYPGTGYNQQIGGTPNSKVHILINSPTWYNQTSPVDTSVSSEGPCGPTKPMIDVKMTETDLPWLLKAANVPYINAHARLEIRKQKISTGSLPVAVPESKPKWVKAYFVDESKAVTDANYVLASTVLAPSGTGAGGTVLWSNPTTGTPAVPTPVGLQVNTADIGVRIALGTTGSPPSGDINATCSANLVACFTGTGPQGLVHIRGWSSAGTGTASAPLVRDAVMLTGTCLEDGYLTATAATDPCSVGVRAKIDGLPSTETVFAQRSSGSNTKATMTRGSDGYWTSTTTLPINAGEGPVGIELFYGNGKGTSMGVVQRVYAGTSSLSSSGPLRSVSISENGVSGANSFERCATATCLHNLVVTVGLTPTLQNAKDANDPVVQLKVVGGGSQNQALDCDPTISNLRDELAMGCSPQYTENTGAAPCPDGSTALWATAQPWQCVAVSNGASAGQVVQGINQRVLGDSNPALSACTAHPNNFASYPNIPDGDTRVVQVLLTSFGAFTGSGSTTVPVTGAANFYITSWSGDPCNDPTKPADQGAIVGHFIQYVSTKNTGNASNEFCDFNALGACVAVFTR